jgi:hypothetical protein
MKSLASQHVVDASAFMHASHCAHDPSNKGWIDECVAIIRDAYRENFPDDDSLEADVCDCAQYAQERVCQAYPKSRAAQMSVLRWCSEFANHLEPDGSPRKKSSGIFGRSLFRRLPILDRRALFRANFPSYFAMAIQQHMVSLLVPCPFHGDACPTQQKLRELYKTESLSP